jgi:hypothetical protein
LCTSAAQLFGRRPFPIFALCTALQSSGLLDRITTAWADTTAPLVREGAMLAFTAVCNDVGPPAEPFLLPLLDTLLSHYADKVLHLSHTGVVSACADNTPHHLWLCWLLVMSVYQ